MVKPGFPWGAVISLLGSIAYGVSPLDLIPDIIPLLGLVDDALLVPILLILAFFGFMRHRKASQAASASGQKVINVPARTVSSESAPVIPQSHRS